MNSVKKCISQAVSAIAVSAPLALIPVGEAHAGATGAMCSSGIMNLASSMGLNMFNMMRSIPIIGGIFGGMGNAMAGEFFNQVLNSPQMTLEMIQCAKGNTGMIDMMIEVISANPALLGKMAAIMKQSTAFTEAFTDLALSDSVLAKFFFAKINSQLYEGLTMSMVNSQQATRNVATLMKKYAKDQMKPSTPFAKLFFNIGTPGSACDGNELSNERFFYAVFSDIPSAESFLAALGSLDAATQKAMTDFVFLARQSDANGNVYNHTSEKYYYNYAFIKAFVKGIAPTYDKTQQPDPASSNPANALFGKMLPMLMTTSNGQMQPTEYGIAFFQAMMAGAAANDPSAKGLMEFLSTLFPAAMFGMIPAPDAGAPAPRDFSTAAACSPGSGTPPGGSGGGTNTTNWLLNSRTSATSNISASSRAVDGSLSSTWTSSRIYSTSQIESVQMNLATPRAMSSIRVNFAYPCEYRIEGVTNSGTVVLGEGRADSVNTFNTLSFGATTLNGVVVKMRNGRSGGNYGVNEVEGY